MKTSIKTYDPVLCSYALCGDTFVPKRRRVQKFCSDSCRTLASKHRKNGQSGFLIKYRSKGVVGHFAGGQKK